MNIQLATTYETRTKICYFLPSYWNSEIEKSKELGPSIADKQIGDDCGRDCGVRCFSNTDKSPHDQETPEGCHVRAE